MSACADPDTPAAAAAPVPPPSIPLSSPLTGEQDRAFVAESLPSYTATLTTEVIHAVTAPVPPAATLALAPPPSIPLGSQLRGEEDRVLATRSTHESTHSSKKKEIPHKCGIRGCRGHRPESFFPCCSSKSCIKCIGSSCYEKILSRFKTMTNVVGKQYCSVACYRKDKKNNNVSKLSWTNDGAKGLDDEHHSRYYLLQWLNNEDNLATWRCRPGGGGATKMEIAAHLVEYLAKKGVRCVILWCMSRNIFT